LHLRRFKGTRKNITAYRGFIKINPEFNKPFLKHGNKYIIVAPGTGTVPKVNLQN